ncbi:Necrosis inducing protein NPP1 [Phytophthora megakarya]|uniref:Necrosis inducing protein NPP1 n=1 Tax=Phytophthora megakarya TaxID=4795 RepID=A0A225WPG5_9STRA|nr:Necrosis inducing protein NPP1 [Phytophthora megakarya]
MNIYALLLDTPKPTVKFLNISEAIGPLPKRNITRNVTIAPRPDPRQVETPEPTYLPTPAPTPPPTPAPTPDPGPWITKTIGHDEVKPFAQPEPVTISEKAGVKFKPQIQIRTGCVPYPAVNDVGETSGGLQTSGSSKGGCRGSGHGSQVYGRGTWIDGYWAIMYAWYFPKDSPSSRMGHRHDWEHAIVFLDNPDVPEPKIMACSVSSHSGYYKYNPCPPWVIDGTSLKVRYKHAWPKNHDLDVTGDAGTFQDLIMWDQLTDDARRALNSVSFGKANTPFNDGTFPHKLKRAWPFK